MPNNPTCDSSGAVSSPRISSCSVIFVADIEDASLGAGDETGEDHAFDDEMREVGEDEAVLDGAGLAFVGVADDVFHGIGLLANQVPLHAGGKARAAHAA